MLLIKINRLHSDNFGQYENDFLFHFISNSIICVYIYDWMQEVKWYVVM